MMQSNTGPREQNGPRTPEGTLITASRIKDTAVYNSSGGFLGIGEKFHPLPWDVLTYDKERDGYVIPLTKEELAGAPSYSTEELTAYGGEDADYRDSVRRYYRRYVVAH